MDTDKRLLHTYRFCPKQPIGIGAPVYPCARDEHGNCWRCDRYGPVKHQYPCTSDQYDAAYVYPHGDTAH
jgi:hypothetical protein